MTSGFVRRSVGGSPIGSLGETRAVPDLCADGAVAPDIGRVGIDGINEAFDAAVCGEVRSAP